jgi:5-methylcytosine-specific restriction endonuclease McrA
MWLAKPGAFAKRHGIPVHRVDLFQLTAEHLHAHRDGGQDTPANIVAACAFCNHQRHAMFPKAAPDPQTYETYVLLNVAAGLWHKQAGS